VRSVAPRQIRDFRAYRGCGSSPWIASSVDSKRVDVVVGLAAGRGSGEHVAELGHGIARQTPRVFGKIPMEVSTAPDVEVEAQWQLRNQT
jgi:hypothetical protein